MEPDTHAALHSVAHFQMYHAYGTPLATAVFKQSIEDFQVDEDLGYELTGSGEHLCLLARKKATTTAAVAERMARAAKVRPSDVGYAGLKDRQGICTQWFSICLPQSRADETDESIVNAVVGDGIEVLRHLRNSKKIRRGSHRANGFTIVLRDLRREFEPFINERLEKIRQGGVPNYFGEQRFGRDNDNIQTALRLFSGQLKLKKGFRRGIILSAARSAVFNAVLSARVGQGNWNRYLEGDVMNLSGSGSVFVPEVWDEVLEQRLQRFDIHPTGPMWGAGELRSSAAARELELTVSDSLAELCQGLEAAGLKQARRSLRLLPEGLGWRFDEGGQDGSSLELKFSLPPGEYATSVLRELCTTDQVVPPSNSEPTSSPRRRGS